MSVSLPDFEVCVDNFSDALTAQSCGAARLELCADLALDGLSPSDDLLHQVLEVAKIPVAIMVRPRAGDFCYQATEVDCMEQEILARRKTGVHGFVFGCNTADGMPDLDACRRLIQAAAGLPCTFHRAFDGCPQPLLAMDQLADLGFRRILTSGDQPTAWQARHTLRDWVNHAGNRIQILPAGKVRADHALALQSYLGCPELHSSSLRIACDVAAESAADDV